MWDNFIYKKGYFSFNLSSKKIRKYCLVNWEIYILYFILCSGPTQGCNLCPGVSTFWNVPVYLSSLSLSLSIYLSIYLSFYLVIYLSIYLLSISSLSTATKISFTSIINSIKRKTVPEITQNFKGTIFSILIIAYAILN